MKMRYNIYESYKPLMEDWNDYISVVREHVEGFSDLEATQLAILLENTKTELEIAKGRLTNGLITETTDVSMVNTFQSTVFDIVTAVMPNLIANDIVSVQPLDRRTGQVFFLKFKYADKKGQIAQNSNMLTPSTGFAGNDYSGERITGEIVVAHGSAQTIDKSLPYFPVIPGSVTLTDGTKSVTDTPTGDGLTGTFAGTLKDGNTNKTITYATGRIHLDIVSTTIDVTATWNYDLNSPDAQVSEVNVSVESEPVVARPRKLKSVYMFDTAYDLKMSFGLDMDTVIMKATSGEIGFEIDNEIMTDLLAIAGSDSGWNSEPPYKGMGIADWQLEIIDAINNASNTILSLTKRYEGTFVICGKNAATTIEGLGKDHFQRVSTGGIVGGPHLCGILEEKYKVYKNPNYDDDAMLVGAKGEMFIEAGYVYAPYIPIFATQLLVDENLKAKRGFCTVYAKKVVNPNMYHRIAITHIESVTPFDVP
jgi:hypothetical protein